MSLAWPGVETLSPSPTSKQLHATMKSLKVSRVSRLPDRPYLPRMLIFELTENLSTASTFAAAFDGWAAGGPQRDQIISKTTKEIGCSVSDCPVRTVSPTFIPRSDLRTPPCRTFDCLYACIVEVTKRSHTHFVVHMYIHHSSGNISFATGKRNPFRHP